jgi:hypothetical protein
MHRDDRNLHASRWLRLQQIASLPLETFMKYVAPLVFTLSFASALSASAQPFSPASQPARLLGSTSAAALPTPEVKGRKGSKRVGGQNSKGKKGRYVGGRK